MKKIKNYPVPEVENIKEMLEKSAEKYKERPAYYTKEFGDKNFKEIKYSQVIKDVNALRNSAN